VSPYSFEPLLQIGFLSILLLFGVILRAKVGFFQRFLIPSCLIGGFLGMLLVNLGVVPISRSSLEMLIYHLLNISFIAIGLTPSPKTENGGGEIARASLGMALIEGVTFPLQAICGGLIVMALGAFGYELFPAFGFLPALGFTEGPGQALSIGRVWEEVGFEHAVTLGLTFSTIGFFFAFFIGIPLVNWGIRKGLSSYPSGGLQEDLVIGLVPRDKRPEPAGRLTTHSANLDALAFQIALVGAVYVLAYALVKTVTRFLPEDIGAVFWGLFFFAGLIVAVSVKFVMERIGAGHLIDQGLQRRISGCSVDFLIVSTLTAIYLVVVWAYIVPILAISTTAGVFTTLVVIYLGKRVWSRHNLERMSAIFGTVMGIVPSGLLLLRVVDPDFKTTAALEIGLMNVFAIPVVLGGIALLQGPALLGWSLWITIIALGGMMALSLILLKALGLWAPPRF
jgi:ESS family glutamate:Na+ symporter